MDGRPIRVRDSLRPEIVDLRTPEAVSSRILGGGRMWLIGAHRRKWLVDGSLILRGQCRHIRVVESDVRVIHDQPQYVTNG